MIISISGPDTYRSREKLKSIQKLGLQKQAKQEIFSFNDIELPDTEETLLARLKQSFNTSSLFVICEALTRLRNTQYVQP
jgi:hypothetical protein